MANRASTSLLLLAAAVAAGCSTSETALEGPVPEAFGPKAVCDLEARAGSNLQGSAIFEAAADGRIVFSIVVERVTPGSHAVHIHEHGDCSAPDATSAGGHWNPTGKKHGKWGQEDGEFHLGDLGNIEVDAGGRGSIEFATDQWEIGTGGPRDIVGKSIIVHAKPDDFTTQPTGAAGDRIGCGVIQRTR
jgi:Cu-Zn family superoxide dismutase